MDAPAENPRRWAILAVMCLALVVTGLDTLIITMALPSIRSQLGATASQLQWIVDSYSLAFAVPILFAGAMSDKFGRRRGFLTGMIVFLIGSFAAVFAQSPETLIAARVGMGLGAAIIMPATLSLIRQVFPARERAKAMGVWVGVASLGVPLGPIVGGILLQNFWWGSVFIINVPVIAVAIVGCLWLIPESRNTRHPGLDVTGLMLSMIGSLLVVYGVIEAPTHGWTSIQTMSCLVVGIVALVSFIVWEHRARNPMLNRAVFIDRRFGGPLVTIATVFFGVFGILFIVTQYLQFALGHSPLVAGFHMLAMCTVVVIAPLSPKLVERFGLGPVSMLGPLFVTISMIVLAIAGTPSSSQILLALALLGIGIGFGAPPSIDSILGATSVEQSGTGSAVADVAMQFGGALGIAVLGSVAASADAGSMRSATLVAAAVAAVGAITVFSILPRTFAASSTPAEAPSAMDLAGPP